MSVFFRRNSHCANAIVKFFGVVFCVCVLVLSSCGELELGKGQDITEDLYHRLVAGMFEPEKDPFIIHVRTQKQRDVSQPAVGTFMRFSWENGSFWVKVDESASVILYMDKEAIFSHLKFFAHKGYQVQTVYFEHPFRPFSTQFTFD